MKEKKIPLLLFGMLLLCLCFALGYVTGRGDRETVVQVSTRQPEAAVQNKIPQTAAPQDIEPEADGDTLIDLNTADELLLQTLPGIGPELADRIVAYREENGPFVAKEQIMDVEGIGEIRYKNLESRITIGGTP